MKSSASPLDEVQQIKACAPVHARDSVTSAPYVYLELDMPPSTNNLFVNVPGVGRVKSKSYSQWISDAGWQLKAQIGSARVEGPIGIILKLVKQNKRRVDLDGKIKGCLDLLVRHKVIEDDSLVQRIEASWVPDGAPCQVMVISTREVGA